MPCRVGGSQSPVCVSVQGVECAFMHACMHGACVLHVSSAHTIHVTSVAVVSLSRVKQCTSKQRSTSTGVTAPVKCDEAQPLLVRLLAVCNSQQRVYYSLTPCRGALCVVCCLLGTPHDCLVWWCVLWRCCDAALQAGCVQRPCLTETQPQFSQQHVIN